MNPKTKQLLGVIVVVVLLLLAIVYIRDRQGAARAFRAGYDSTAGTGPR